MWNIHEEKYFSQLRILNLSINSFVNPFADISLTFSDNLFHSILFKKTSLFHFLSLLSKSAFFYEIIHIVFVA